MKILCILFTRTIVYYIWNVQLLYNYNCIEPTIKQISYIYTYQCVQMHVDCRSWNESKNQQQDEMAMKEEKNEHYYNSIFAYGIIIMCFICIQ